MAPTQLSLCLLLAGLSFTATLAHSDDSAAPITLAPAPASPADALIKAGYEAAQKNDIPGATKAFQEATKLDPNNAIAYCELGRVLAFQSKLDEAIAAYDKALSLNSKLAGAYCERGSAKAQKNNFDGALADFAQAITLSPKFGKAYYGRGHVKYFKGDMDGAEADLNQALLLEPTLIVANFVRGLVELGENNPDAATADFEKATPTFAYASLWLWIVKMQANDPAGAKAMLVKAMENTTLFPPRKWETSIGELFLGKLTQEQLMTRAQDSDDPKEHECEGFFYAGIVKLLAGDKATAQDCFRQSMATGYRSTEEYVEAQRQAAKLKTP